MQDFIQQAISQLGISQAQGETATGGALALLKNNLDGDTFANLSGKLPGAQGLVEAFLAKQGAAGGGGGGLLGGLSSMLGSAVGGDVGNIAALVAQVASSGVNADTMAKFLPLLAGFIKSKTGFDVSGILGADAAASPLAGLAKGLFS